MCRSAGLMTNNKENRGNRRMSKKFLLGALALGVAVPALVVPMQGTVKANDKVTLEDRQFDGYSLEDIKNLGLIFAKNNNYMFKTLLTESGKVYQWENSTTEKYPTEVTGLPNNIIKVSKGGNLGHTVALTSEGDVYTYGANTYGQLGDGGTVKRQSKDAYKVEGLPKIKEVYSGDRTTYAIAEDGDLYGWGDIDHKYVQNDLYKTPFKIDGIKNVVSLKLITSQVQAQEEGGRVYTWRTTSDIKELTDLKGADDWVIRGDNTFSAIFNGEILVWGVDADFLYTSAGKNVSKSNAYKIPGVTNAVKFNLGSNSWYITEDNDLYTWGASKGIGHPVGAITAPKRVEGIKVKSMSGINGTYHVIDTSGEIYAWGSPQGNGLGNGTTSSGGTVSQDEPLKLEKVINSSKVTVNFKEMTSRDVKVSWKGISGTTYIVKKNGEVIHNDTSTEFIDGNVLTGGKYEYEFTVKNDYTNDVVSKKMVYVHGEEPDFTIPEQPTDPESPTVNDDWSFANPSAPFKGVKPTITLVGGKPATDILISSADWVEGETVVSTELGDVVLTPDGNGNTLVSVPAGLGDKDTTTTINVEHEGTHFMNIVIKAVPKLDFVFGK